MHKLGVYRLAKGGRDRLKEHGFVIQVPVVVNTNTAQVLVVTEIPLTPPAFKIDEIHKLIEIDDCAAACDKVIINGRLIKNIHTTVNGATGGKHRFENTCLGSSPRRTSGLLSR